MNNFNRNIWRQELISSLVIFGILISFIFTVFISSSDLLEAWRMNLNQAHEIEFNFEEIRNLLALFSVYLFFIIGPTFIVALFIGVRRLMVDATYVKKSYMPKTNFFYSIIEITIISIIFFAYIFFQLDQILAVSSLPVQEIFPFISKITIQVVSIVIIVKLIFLFGINFFQRIQSEQKSH